MSCGVTIASSKLPSFERECRNVGKVRGDSNASEIEVESFVQFFQKPVHPYEQYQRRLCGSHPAIKQASSQCGDDSRSIDVQTEVVQFESKGCQWAAGFDDTLLDDAIKRAKGSRGKHPAREKAGLPRTAADLAASASRFGQFLRLASVAMEIICEENVGREQAHERSLHIDRDGHSGRKGMFASSSPWTTLDSSVESEPIAVATGKGCPGVVAVACRSLDPAHADIVTLWRDTSVASESPLSVLGIEIGSRLSCVALSEDHLGPPVCVAGTEEGGVVLWDLRQRQHTPNLFSPPTCVSLGLDGGHISSIVGVKFIPFAPSGGNAAHGGSNVGKMHSSFQLASLDDRCCMVIWASMQLTVESESESWKREPADAYSIPGARLGFSAMHTFSVSSPWRSPKDLEPAGMGPGCTCLCGVPWDPSRLLVGTTNGKIIRVSRLGGRGGASPTIYLPAVGELSAPSSKVVPCAEQVTCLATSAEVPGYFAAGCSDGSIRLYWEGAARPVSSWSGLSELEADENSLKSIVSTHAAIAGLSWSPHRTGILYVMDAHSIVYVFDLSKGVSGPIFSHRVTPDGDAKCGSCTIALSWGRIEAGAKPWIYVLGSKLARRELAHELALASEVAVSDDALICSSTALSPLERERERER